MGADDPEITKLVETTNEHEEVIIDQVVTEAQLAYKAHQKLLEKEPEAAALLSPSDLLPKVNSVVRKLWDKLKGNDDDDESQFVTRDELMELMNQRRR